MADPKDDRVFSCDCCDEEIDEPVSVNVPVGGGGVGMLDFCAACAAEKMQKMFERLGVEHGSKFVMEIKAESAKRSVRERRVEDVEEEED